MGTEDRRVHPIFCQAVELKSADERASFLDTACNGDTRLRERVERLLNAQAHVDDFLESPALVDGPGFSLSDAEEGPGTVIGQYELMERIGEGGFGTVYRAECRKPVARTVALKIIRLGMDTKQVIARFNAERQAMAVMDHPNIARVLDAGATDTGRPYIVMELVKGQPINEFCDTLKLTMEGRLRLFCEVCDAIYHAHGRGVVHRDIKPSNILVTTQDGKPVAKVIDFGIAKAIHAPLSDESIVTRDGQLIGTPQYMSPEQADLSPLEIGPRSDIYSLGVLLYELITGTTPLESDRLTAVGLEKMRQMILEQETVKPSVRLRNRVHALASIAQLRGTSTSEIHPLVSGDLDWIALKALEKDPGRRYATVGQLQNDVRCFLENKPILARKPTYVDRLTRWSHRHRSLIATVAAGLVAISILATMAYMNEKSASKELAANLYASIVREVRTSRLARTEGYRELAFRQLEKARQLSTPIDLVELRREAVECMGDFLGFRPHVLDTFPLPIQALAMNPKSAEIALGFNNGTVMIYDLARLGQLERVAELHNHPGPVNAMVYVPDGKTLITGHDKGTFQIWQLEPNGRWAFGRSINTDETLTTWSLNVTGDGQQFGALLIQDLPAHALKRKVPSRVRMWSVKDGVESIPFSNPQRMFTGSMAFSPDGRILVTGHTGLTERGFHVWDVASREILRKVKTTSSRVIELSFSPDSRILACALEDGFALFETERFTRQTFVRGTTASWVAFSPDGRLMAVGARGGKPVIDLWNVAANRLLAVVPVALAGQPRSIGGAFSFDGRLLVSAAPGSVRISNLAAPTERILLSGHEAGVNEVAFSFDGKLLASAGDDHAVKIWNTSTGESVTALTDYQRPVATVAFSPDGKLMATGGREIVIRSASSFEKVATLQPDFHPVQVWDVEFSPSSDHFTAACEFGLAVWRISPQVDTESSRFEMIGSVGKRMTHACCFSPDGKRIAYSSQESTGKTIQVFDVANGQPLPVDGPRLSPARPPGMRFHPDGQQIIYTAPGNVVKSWNLVTREKSSVVEQAYSRMSLNSDAVWLAVRGPDSRAEVSIWDYERLIRLFSLPDAGATVETIAWSPNAELLAVGLADGGLSIWSIPEIRAHLDEIGLNW